MRKQVSNPFRESSFSIPQKIITTQIKTICQQLGLHLFQFGSGLSGSDLDLIAFSEDMSQLSRIAVAANSIMIPIRN
jgi:hypothetical protein